MQSLMSSSGKNIKTERTMSKNYRFRALRFDENTDKIVFELPRMHKNARLVVGEMTFCDAFNDCEPYDRKSHIFYVPHRYLSPESVLKLKLRDFPSGMIPSSISCRFGDSQQVTSDELKNECDNRLELQSEEKERPGEGVEYRHALYNNKYGAPVHVFSLTVDMAKAALYTGTPDDGYAAKKVKATIPDMIAAAEKNGKHVIASINGDFFDIFGDMHPSGLVIKNGYLIANADSKRAFIGMTKDGKAIVTDLIENPDITGSLECAVAGLQRIVKNGELHDWAVMESFGYTPHPRSAAGVTADGKAVLVVVDGRIPDYSNGASLVDLGKLMLSFGCVEAVNLDGGGSSAIYTRNEDEFELRSVPADLFKPNDKLIRKEANCVMVIKK